MSLAFISLGGDQGDPLATQLEAIALIGPRVGSVVKTSSFYRTQPWGVDRKEPFVNSVICVDTELPVDEVFEELILIETELGRVRNGVQYAERAIDLDLLYFNDEIIRTDKLTIPHPRAHLRKFVLVPMNEIAPEHVDPFRGRTIRELLNACSDVCDIEILECATTI